MSPRTVSWLVCLALCALLAGAYSYVTPVFDAASWWRVLFFAGIGVLGLLSVFLFPDFKSVRAQLLAIVIPAVVLRALLLPTAPSDDVNRYLWEGKLIRAGVSPYAERGDAESLSVYRDDFWLAMNHKDKPTAYPPLAELVFAGIGAVAYSPMAYKLSFAALDLLVICGLLYLLWRRGVSLAFSGFYALSPIALISYAGEGHFDILMVVALVFAVCASELGKSKWSSAWLALSASMKWVTLPLLPFFLGRKWFGGGLLALVVLAVPAVIFANTLIPLLGGLAEFGGTRSFNGPVYNVLLLVFGFERMVCNWTVAILLGVVYLWRMWLRYAATLDSHIRWFLGALIVLSPTVHFWYLAWILPFVALRPNVAWLSLSVSSSLYFCVWIEADWGLAGWQHVLFWTPFTAGCFYELWTTRGAMLRCMSRPVASRRDTVAIVIPTHNAAETLEQALFSIERQTVLPVEVVLADGGSTDATQAIFRTTHLAAKIVTSQLGRGQQIFAGVEATTAEWVIVLHADAVLHDYSIEALLRMAEHDSTLLGGAFGQRFRERSFRLMLVECLNEMRALLTRTAFGDQAQFFHRETLLKHHLMPQQPLMEDVESSWRIRESGRFVYLGLPVTVSAEKWITVGWWKRVKLVTQLVARYGRARMSGREHAKKLSDDLYEQYYMEGG